MGIGIVTQTIETDESETSNEKNTIEMKVTFNNQVNFSNNLEIEEFTEENSLNLDQLEQKNSLMQAISERIQLVNKEQMEQLCLSEDNNPLQLMLPKLLGNNNGVLENINANETEIATFNEKFEMYGGTNVMGTTVRGLISIIASNNGLDDEEDEENESNESLFSSNEETTNLIEEIHFDGSEYEVNKQNITLIKSSIEPESYYRVEFEKEENTGKIYRVVINKK